MKYDRTVIAYHGCDADTAQRLFDGEPFRPSKNDYDWLGKGIYFWEHGPARALEFARTQQRRGGKVRRPAAIGALIQLGNCFDLMDSFYTKELASAFDILQLTYALDGAPMPTNSGSTPDRLLRELDCAVMNTYFDVVEDLGNKPRYDTVRCGFTEGARAFPGSEIRLQGHIQLAVRNPACIIGLFKPMVNS